MPDDVADSEESKTRAVIERSKEIYLYSSSWLGDENGAHVQGNTCRGSLWNRYIRPFHMCGGCNTAVLHQQLRDNAHATNHTHKYPQACLMGVAAFFELFEPFLFVIVLLSCCFG
jgi:hypothetical protein